MGKILTVKEGTLQTVSGRILEVGSEQWQVWLNENASFRYEATNGRPGYTVRKDRGNYWYGYRKIQGKLHKKAVGNSTKLTVERLNEIALALDGGLPDVTQGLTNEVTEYVTTELHQLRTELQKEIAVLRQELRLLAGKLIAR